MYANIGYLLMMFFWVFMPVDSYSQTKDLFTVSVVHKLEERDSYSVFYPRETDALRGVIVLIHSDQASNPKVYGNFIEKLIRDNYIVIYPAYQDYVVSANKKDLSSPWKRHTLISKKIIKKYSIYLLHS